MAIKNTSLLLLFLCISNLYAQENNEQTSQNKTPSNIINVVGTKKNVDIKDIYNNVKSLDTEELAIGNPSTIYDQLQNVAGVTLNSEFRGVIDIRGQGTDKSRRNVQVLVDDVPLNFLDYTHYFPGYTTVPADSITSIDILSGSGSVIYGNGTQGGVVNLSTNFMSYEKKPNYITFGFGSFATKKRGINFSNNSLLNNKLTIAFTYSGENNKAFRKGEYMNSDYLSLSSMYKITDSQAIGYAFSRYTEDGLFSGTVSEYKIDKDWLASGTLYSRYRHMDTHKLAYQGSFSIFEVSNKAFYLDSDWKQNSSTSKVDIGSFYNKVLGNKLKIKTNYLDNGSFLLLGNDLIRMQQTTTLKADNWDYSRDTLALFAVNKTYIYDGIYSTQGYRFNRDFSGRQSPNGSNTSIHGGTSKTFKKTNNNSAAEFILGYDSDIISPYAKVETGFTAPDATMLVDKYDGVYEFNNLKYETYITYEIGSEINFSDSFSVKTALFNTHTENEISTWNIDALQKNSRAINIGSSLRKGIELGFNYSINNIFNLFANLTYTDATMTKFNVAEVERLKNSVDDQKTKDRIDSLLKKAQINEHQKLAKVPPVSIVAGVEMRFSENLKLTNTINYLSSHLSEMITGYELGQRLLLDLDLRYSTKKYEVGIGSKNFFDQKYYALARGTTVTQGMPRTFYVDLKYKF